MRYHVRLVQTGTELHQLEPDWTTLLQGMPAATVFASFEWNAAWWHHFGAGRTLFVLVVSDDSGQTALIAPMMISRHGPVRKLEFIGMGLSDYGDFLINPATARPALDALLTYLSNHHSAWDLADWSEVPPDSVLLSYLNSSKVRNLSLSLVPQTYCTMIALPLTWGEYIQSLLRRRRYYVNSFPQKFLREQNGNVRVTTSRSEVTEEVARFYSLHLARWQGNQDLSAEHTDPAFRPFLDEVCGAFADRGWLQMVSLCAKNQTVAASINFLYFNRWNSYMKGFDPGWSEARPGTVLDAFRLKQAIDVGASLFDFGRGDEQYKSGFGVTYTRNTRVLIAARSPVSMAAFVLLLLRKGYRDFRSRHAAQLRVNNAPE